MQAKVLLQTAAGVALAGKSLESKHGSLSQSNPYGARPYRGHSSLTLRRSSSGIGLRADGEKKSLVQQMTRSSTLTPSMAVIAGQDKIVELKGLMSPPAVELGGKYGNVVTCSRVPTVHKGWRAIAVDGQRLGSSELASALATARQRSRYTVTFRIGDQELDESLPSATETDILSSHLRENERRASEQVERERVIAECNESVDQERLAFEDARRKVAEEEERCKREALEAQRREHDLAEAEKQRVAQVAGEDARERQAAEENRRLMLAAEAKRKEEEEARRRAAENEEQRRRADEAAEKCAIEEAERLQAVELKATRDVVTKRLEKECGLPPRSSIDDPQQALMKALCQPKVAVPQKKRGGPCDKCDGPHHEDDCPHFKKKRDGHKDAFDKYGKKKSDSDEGDGTVIIKSARIIPQPGDGSCLFHSVAYGMKGADATKLRAEIADYIASSPNVLIANNPIKDWVLWDSGMDVKAYARTMRTGSRWGGAVELAVCAQLKAVAIHIYEKGAKGYARISTFGDESRVVNLHYGGRVHYDALQI